VCTDGEDVWLSVVGWILCYIPVQGYVVDGLSVLEHWLMFDGWILYCCIGLRCRRIVYCCCCCCCCCDGYRDNLAGEPSRQGAANQVLQVL